MRQRLDRLGDFIYRSLFGLLVTAIVWGLGVELTMAAGSQGDERAGWSVFSLAFAACVGIATARAIRWHRRRR